MSSSKGKIARLLGGLLLRRANIVNADDVGGFRRIVLRGGGATPRAGTKVQMLLPSDDMRTYTPIASSDGMVLLGWKHAGGPGARWLSEVAAGGEVRFVGPQRSLDLRAGPIVFVGDETSVAVAAGFEGERPGQVRAIFQANSVDEVRTAAEAVGLRPISVVPRGETDHLVEAVAAAHAADRHAVVALTGGSELVLAVRSGLRQRGIRDIKTKTYWIPGKRGLD